MRKGECNACTKTFLDRNVHHLDKKQPTLCCGTGTLIVPEACIENKIVTV